MHHEHHAAVIAPALNAALYSYYLLLFQEIARVASMIEASANDDTSQPRPHEAIGYTAIIDIGGDDWEIKSGWYGVHHILS